MSTARKRRLGITKYNTIPCKKKSTINELYDEIEQLQFDYPKSYIQQLNNIKNVQIKSNMDPQLREKLVTLINTPNDAIDFKRPGIIKSLKMWYIISHVNFQNDWHQSLNYIIGENGSGKSSIMAGFLLAFGAKAAATGKKSAKDCINYNCNTSYAKVEITLTHGGELDPRKYGDNVQISRIIEMSGVSKYQIRTAEGKMRSLDRKELDRILVTLQIMVDNPLQFLNQSVATKFLRVKDPKAIYNYFYRATRLHDCEMLIKNTTDDLNYAGRILAVRMETQITLQMDASSKKKDYDAILQLQEMKGKIFILQREYKWSLVIYAEKELKKIQDEIMKINRELDGYKKKLDLNGDLKAELEKSYEAESIYLKKLIQNLHYNHQLHDKYHHNVELIKTKVNTINCEIKCATITISKQLIDKKKIELKIQKIECDVEINIEKHIRENQLNSIRLIELLKNLKIQLNNSSANNELIGKELKILKQSHDEKRKMIFIASEQIALKKNEQKNNKIVVKRNRYDRFGHEMIQLMDKLNENINKFHIKPRGPQGACYTVKEMYKEYAPIIEYIMYSTLYTFKVTSQHDHDLLLKLINQVYSNVRRKGVRRPDVFWIKVTSTEKVYKLTRKAKCEFPTLLDTLDIIDDDVSVINWLVDSKGVDRILMFPTFKEGCYIMKSKERVPPTCTIGYTQDFRVLHPVPSYRVMVKQLRRKANFIQVTSTEHFEMENLQIEIEQLEMDHNEMKIECDLLNRQLKEKNSQYQYGEKEIKKFTNEWINVDKEYSNLNNGYNYTTDIESHKEEQEYLINSIKKKEEEKIQLNITLNDLIPKLTNAIQLLRNIDKEIDNDQMKKNEIEGKNIVISETNRLQREEDKLILIIRQLEVTERNAMKRSKEAEGKLNEKRIEGEKKCQRVDTKRDGEIIKKEIDSLLFIVEKNKSKLSHLGRNEIAWIKADHIAKAHERVNNILERLVECVARMKNVISIHFHRTKINYGLSLTANFNALISMRHYKGELNVDHEDRTLTYYVCSDSSSEANAKKNFQMKIDGNYKIVNKKGIRNYMAGLSGGERSFSTVCFMVTLWNIMEAPFYILDEFEVFMDAEHKAKCHQILRDHAKKQPDAQFFFFSPLEMENMPSSNEACVLRLYPPVRDLPGKHLNDDIPIIDIKKRKIINSDSE